MIYTNIHFCQITVTPSNISVTYANVNIISVTQRVALVVDSRLLKPYRSTTKMKFIRRD